LPPQRSYTIFRNLKHRSPLCNIHIGRRTGTSVKAEHFKTNRVERRDPGSAARELKEGCMSHSSESSFGARSTSPMSNSNSYNPVKTASSPMEQATIGTSLHIKGEITGSEALYIDGRVEGKITMPDSRITVGRNGKVDASIVARDVVVMGCVKGNIQCSDRVDIRSEGSVTGDVSTLRISVEDGAMLKGGIEVRSGEQKKQQQKAPEPSKTSSQEMEIEVDVESALAAPAGG
jgi:cytoskeletal protein CcmA (bactofilin family)